MVWPSDAERERFWGGLIARYDRRLRAYASRTHCSVGEADEIVADVWADLTARDDSEWREEPWPVLLSLLRARCAEQMRTWRREAPLRGWDQPGGTEDPAVDPEFRLAVNEWWKRAAIHLTEPQQIAVTFRCMWGWESTQVANVLGTTEATMRVHLMRGLRKLRKLVKVIPPPRAD
jgi:DNA-directed RNA polymerase specialized sigma24 family protein